MKGLRGSVRALFCALLLQVRVRHTASQIVCDPSKTGGTRNDYCIIGTTCFFNGEQAYCYNCPSGKYGYKPTEHMHGTCVSCSRGKWSAEKSDSRYDCYNCHATGQYWVEGQGCKSCLLNQWASGQHNLQGYTDDGVYCYYVGNSFWSDTYPEILSPSKCVADHCENCEVGTYSRIEWNSCCMPGYSRKHSNKQEMYEATPVPEYETFKDCEECPAGKYFTQHTPPASAQYTCTACDKGTYSLKQATRCTTCATGKFSLIPSSTCTDCSAGKFNNVQGYWECTICAAGTYSAAGASSCTACAAGKFATSGNPCSDCAAGTFSAPSASSCTACPEAKYSLQGATACSDCTAGKYWNSAQWTCLDCAAGKYAASGNPCSDCAAGKFSTLTGASVSSTCSNCVAGKYSGAGASVCTNCVAGKFSAAGDLGCTPCSAGTYSGAGASVCTNCVAGKYSSAGWSVCPDCVAGKFSAAGVASCTACSAGTYTAAGGASVCTDCLAGKFSSVIGASADCGASCLAGKYSGARASVCINCVAGKFSAARGAASCTDCSAGTFSAAAASSCTDCSEGTFSAAAASSCTDCRAGTFSAAVGASTCVNCAAGKYSDVEGATDFLTCVNCAAGKYGETSGAAAENNCLSCPVRTRSDAGSAVCTCEEGWEGPPCTPTALGNAAGLFRLRVHNDAFTYWKTCSSNEMLSAGELFDMQVAPFQDYANSLSWLLPLPEGVGLLNVSFVCERPETPLQFSECDSLPRAADVFVRQSAYEPRSQEASPEVPCADNGVGGWWCAATQNPVLRSLQNVHAHVRGAPSAGQHYGNANGVKYTFQTTSIDEIKHKQLRQAHAWAPFEGCAVLLTSAAVTADLEGESSVNTVMCAGAEKIEIVADSGSDSPFTWLGAFGYNLEGMRYMMLMLKKQGAHSTSLAWNEPSTQTVRYVHDSAGLSLSWVSVCVETVDTVQHMAALGVNVNNKVEVGFFRLAKTPADKIELLAVGEGMQFTLGYDAGIDPGGNESSVSTSDPWMYYSRVVVGAGTTSPNVLVAGVKPEQGLSAEGSPGGSRLCLHVCAARFSRDETSCSQVNLLQAHTAQVSFISAAALDRGTAVADRGTGSATVDRAYWVVGVFGAVYIVTTTYDAGASELVSVAIQLEHSDLADVHFVKVGALFYTFDVSENEFSQSTSVGVLTYLPGFERMQHNSSQVLAYAVVVVPHPGEEGLQPNARLPNMLKLKGHRASYHIAVSGGPGLPVYQRTGASASGNESTQLVTSEHTPSPFATHRAGFLATYENGLNHRIGLPHAYGRYEMQGGACQFKDTTAPDEEQLELVWSGTPARPLAILMFTVPCRGSLLVKDTRIPVADDTCQSGTRDVVIVVKHNSMGSGSQQTAYYLRPGTDLLATPTVTNYDAETLSIFMGKGGAWVYSVYAENIQRSEVRSWLTRARQLRQQSDNSATPVGRAWQRERQVLTLNPVKDMQLELAFERSQVPTAQKVSVGVDDVQLTPVLSQVPPLLGSRGQLCTPVHVPSKEELEQVGLAHLVRGLSDDWDRVHITVGVQTEHERVCTYEVRLYEYDEDELEVSSQCPEEADFEPSCQGVCRIRCRLTTSPDSVRGAYQECQLQVPTPSQTQVGVVVWPSESACLLGANDSLVVSLRPYTAVYECPDKGEFVDFRDSCSNCHESEAARTACQLGQRLQGCPVLDSASKEDVKCVDCIEGADLVQAGVAEWVRSSVSICAWKCKEQNYESQVLGRRQCKACTDAAEVVCSAGELKQRCGQFSDTECVLCPEVNKGSYSTNEMFVAGCISQCKPGHYNDTSRHQEGRCLRCWDRNELLRHADVEKVPFVYFKNCTQTANADWKACPQEDGSTLVGSDPGFTGHCLRECKVGWHLEPGNLTCVKCPHPRHVENGWPTSQDLNSSAFTWNPGSCSFTCTPPYLSTHRNHNNSEHTCVLCNICLNGQYPSGPYCACNSCLR